MGQVGLKIGQKSFSVTKAIHDSLISNDVKDMARMFISTFPENWTVNWGPGPFTMLQQEMHGHDTEDRCYGHIDVIDFVTYRWELAQLTDLFLARFSLVAPEG